MSRRFVSFRRGRHRALGSGPLSAPPGIYKSSIGGSSYLGSDKLIGQYGRIIYLFDPNGGKSPPAPIVGGVVRMPPYDAFGDAWYCIGEGSEITEPSSDVKRFSLRNLTRLPSCTGRTGTGTASVTIRPPPGYEISATSSFAEFGGTHLVLRDWWERSAKFSFGDAELQHQSYVDLRTATPLPRASSGPLDSATTEAVWFFSEYASNLVRMSCAEAGHVSYTEDGTFQFELSNMGALVSCPGEPIPNNSLEFILDD